jgi:hypothetical protein
VPPAAGVPNLPRFKNPRNNESRLYSLTIDDLVKMVGSMEAAAEVCRSRPDHCVDDVLDGDLGKGAGEV